MAGGDGTVLSVVEYLHLSEIDLNKCIFGHLPLGTGNDLSNSLGFGGINNVYLCNLAVAPINTDIKQLKKALMGYYNAELTKVDVWQMKLLVDEQDGEILEITSKSKELKRAKTDSDNNTIRSYKRSFINYLSLGYDARVGFGFEKSRSGSRCCNKCIYFWEGMKKNCCRKTVKLDSFLESFQVVKLEDVRYISIFILCF